MNVDYWVFTSGEKGIHELDWGVKYASPTFTDRLSLDIRYRALLKDFSLPPSLSRPDIDAGMLLLPWDNGAALGFVFPGNDHQGRPNTSAIVCIVPESISRNFSVADATRYLWENNDLESIALHAGKERPDALSFDGDCVVSKQPPSFVSVLDWPSSTEGYLQVNGVLKKLARVIPEETEQEKDKKAPHNPMPLKKIALLMVVVASIGFITVLKMNSDAPEKSVLPQTDQQINNDAETKQQEKRERLERERQEEKERREREKAEARQKEEKERREREKMKAEEEAQKAKEKADAEQKALRNEAESVWKSLSLSNNQAGALVDILKAEQFEHGDYGYQFKSAMDTALIKTQLESIINKKDDKGNQLRIELKRDDDWENFKKSWPDDSVFEADKLSPANDNDEHLEDIYEKLKLILAETGKEKVEIVFVFKTSNKRLNLAFRRTIHSVSSGKPERYILTKSKDFIETDLHLFDNVKSKKKVLRLNKSDTRLGEFFGF